MSANTETRGRQWDFWDRNRFLKNLGFVFFRILIFQKIKISHHLAVIADVLITSGLSVISG